MAKKTDSSNDAAAAQPSQEAIYEAAVKRYQGALDLLHKGDYAAAKSEFDGLAGEVDDEPVLTERCRTYATICERRMAPAAAAPDSVDAFYHRGVMLTNDGELDEAIKAYDQALKGAPGSARVFYGRASAWALKGKVDAAIGDLRQSIAIDPQIRFQAANDPDFDGIREEPAFIDIIEPTPSGV